MSAHEPRLIVPFVSATYCSRDCQVFDWKQIGHKFLCQSMKISDGLAVPSDSNQAETKMAHLREQNISVVASKIFFSHVDSILMQALLQQYDIQHCITLINLCQAPPTATVKLASEVLSDNMVSEYLDGEVVKKNRQNGDLTVWVWASVPCSIGITYGPCLILTIPGTRAPFGSWITAQVRMKRTKKGEVLSLQKNPDALASQLQELMLSKCRLD